MHTTMSPGTSWERSRSLAALVVLAILATLVVLVAAAPSASAANPLGTKYSGQNANAGQADPFTTVSYDGGVTWSPAYIAGAFGSHPWDDGGDSTWGVDPNAKWINCTASFFACINQTVLYRTTVVLADAGDLSLTFHVLADNAATPYINGVLAGPTFRGTLDDGTVDIDPSLLRHGVNTFDMEFIDEGGWAGFRYDLVGTLGNQKPVITTVASSSPDATSASGTAVYFQPPTANDVEDGPLPVTCTRFAASVYPLGTTTVTCSATDSANATVTTSFTVTVVDRTAPVVSTPSGITVEAVSAAGATVSWSASAFDAVSGNRPVTCSMVPGSTFPVGTRFVSCSAVDNYGNVGSRSFAVVVQDTTAPVLVLPGTITVEATGPTTPVTFTASATDAVDGSRTVSCTFASSTAFGVGSYTNACSASDTRGHVASGSFSVVIQDTTKPVLNVPQDIVAEATSANGAAVSIAASAVDLVSGNRAVTCNRQLGTSTYALGATTVTCSASDGRGNTATATFKVTVRDTTAPTVNVASSISIEGNTRGGAIVNFTSTGFDTVSGIRPVTCTPASGTVFAIGSTDGTCTANDAAGNIKVVGFTVFVRDTTSPVVIVPNNIAEPAVASYGAPVNFSASASDIVDGDLSPGCSAQSGDPFTVGTTTVTCLVQDSAGNMASASFDVLVYDATPPTLSLPENLVVEAIGPQGAPVHYAAAAHDDITGVVPVLCSVPSGAVVPLGTHVVTCEGADAAGNRAFGSFTLSVVDTTAPVVGFPAGAVHIEGNVLGGATVTFTAAAADTVSGPLETVCSAESGAVFPLGASDVTCFASDAAGNVGSGHLGVVVTDTASPQLVLSGDIVTEALSAAGTPVAFAAAATDVVDGPIAPVCDAASGQVFPLGSTTVGCSATDAQGNRSSGSFHVAVVDTTAPVVTAPADRTLEATGPGGAVATYAASATDAVDATPAISCSAPSGATFGLGATIVSCTATDDAGNVGMASFTVTVVDTTAPVLNVPATIVAEAASASGTVVGYSSTATDVVSGALAPTCTPASGTRFAIGITIVSCTVVDGAGNTTTEAFTVKVADRTAPVVTFTGNRATYGVDETVAIGCSVSDAVTALTCAGISGPAYSFGLGGESVTRTATDAAGNIGRGTATFTVVVTKDNLCALVTRYLADDKGVANSLCVKLRAGSYGAFRNELKAQSGKKLTAAQATLLTELSLGLG
ncbi:MAG: putative cell surface protein [Actinomycetia bacterium]|nr:putative cell surface protein [Actinomycetes bacterium]